jgi:4-hydroxybenzoyl-CoA thioesterase/acyl-CoA thioester hydrolase
MSAPFRTTRRVEFRDTDAAGIAHFSVFFNYMEEAEHELLRSIGSSVLLQDDAGTTSWPRVAVSCDYRGAVRFEDELAIEVRVERLGEKSVTYAFRFHHQDRDVAEGRITAVYCRVGPAGLRSLPVPAELREKLQVFGGHGN